MTEEIAAERKEMQMQTNSPEPEATEWNPQKQHLLQLELRSSRLQFYSSSSESGLPADESAHVPQLWPHCVKHLVFKLLVLGLAFTLRVLAHLSHWQLTRTSHCQWQPPKSHSPQCPRRAGPLAVLRGKAVSQSTEGACFSGMDPAFTFTLAF